MDETYDVLGDALELADEVLGEDDDTITPEDLEILGYDDEGNEILGRRHYRGRSRHYRGRRHYRRPSHGRRLMVHPVISSKPTLLGTGIPGVSGPSVKKIPLGLGSMTFDASSGTTDFTLTARPQVPVRGRRLIVVVTRSSGASAIAANASDLEVGNKSQFAGGGEIPLETFGPEVMDSTLVFDQADPGIEIRLKGSISAIPAAGESVTITASILCDAVS